MPAGSVRELKLGRQQYLDCGYNGELLGCDWQNSVMVPAASNSDISCHKNKITEITDSRTTLKRMSANQSEPSGGGP